jgi:hypothetical protein
MKGERRKKVRREEKRGGEWSPRTRGRSRWRKGRRKEEVESCSSKQHDTAY